MHLLRWLGNRVSKLAPIGLLVVLIMFLFGKNKRTEYELWYMNRSVKAISLLKENTQCEIPVLDPFESGMVRFFQRRSHRSRCTKHKSYFRSGMSSDNQSIIIRDTNAFDPNLIFCCYEVVVFKKSHPFSRIRIPSSCISIVQDEVIVPTNAEHVLIQCFDVENHKGNSKQTFYVRDTTKHEEILTFPPILIYNAQQLTPSEMIERKKLNVIIFGLDGISRMNFIRLMRKSYRYLISDLQAIDLEGYVKVGDSTLVNSFAFLMGLNFTQVRQSCWKKENIKFDTCPFVWKLYSRLGYTTLFAEDYDSVFHHNLGGFAKYPTDYYLFPFSKWMVKKAERNDFGSPDCIRNKSILHRIVDYAKTTTVLLKDTLSFQLYWSGLVSYGWADPIIFDKQFLEMLHLWNGTGILNQSLVIILSDHGWRVNQPMMTKQGQSENRMPFAFLLFPQWFKETYNNAYNNLVRNQWKLTSPYDIHATLLDILNIPDNLQADSIIKHEKSSHTFKGKSTSLFLPIPADRTCKTLDIEEIWCVCDKYEQIDVRSSTASRLAATAVKIINKKLEDFPACYNYTLGNIYSVEQKIHNYSILEDKVTYRLIIQVSPKGAAFQLVLFVDDNNVITMSNEVFRVNAFVYPCYRRLDIKNLCSCEVSFANALI